MPVGERVGEQTDCPQRSHMHRDLIGKLHSGEAQGARRLQQKEGKSQTS